MEKFVEVSNNNDTQNGWHDKCSREQIPFIVVEKRTKYANVRWDHITVSLAMEKLIQKNLESHRGELEGIFERYRNPKSLRRIDWSQVNFDNLEVDKARLAANELYDVVVKIMAKEQ